jgi:ribosomal protein S6--L-glutamate ligase
MNIALLGSPTSWYLRDLERAAGQRHVIVPIAFDSITSRIATGDIAVIGKSHASGQMVSLNEFDGVLVRTMPPGSLEQVVFRMDALAALEAGGTRVINPPKAIEAAVDKYLTTMRLAQHGIPVPQTIACQTFDQAMEAFHSLGGDVVLKPIFGGEGRGIARIVDEALAHRAFRMLEGLGAVLYVQEFIPHDGSDLRLLWIGDRYVAVRRRNPLDWRTNVSRGAVAEQAETTPELLDLSRQAVLAVGATMAGVDLLQRPDGTWTVLEVNAVPGWQATARATGIDVAAWVLELF